MGALRSGTVLKTEAGRTVTPSWYTSEHGHLGGVGEREPVQKLVEMITTRILVSEGVKK